jgi:hypothetical protein
MASTCGLPIINNDLHLQIRPAETIERAATNRCGYQIQGGAAIVACVQLGRNTD